MADSILQLPIGQKAQRNALEQLASTYQPKLTSTILATGDTEALYGKIIGTEEAYFLNPDYTRDKVFDMKLSPASMYRNPTEAGWEWTSVNPSVLIM